MHFTDSRPNVSTLLCAACVVALFFGLLFTVFKLVNPVELSSNDDPYFHARFAALYAQEAPINLPYTSSLTHFGDGNTHYLAYHWLLGKAVSFANGANDPLKLILSVKLFHAALTGIFFGVFFIVAARLSIHMNAGRYAIPIGIGAALLVYSLDPGFTHRIYTERPQIVAIILFIGLIDALITHSRLRVFLLSLIFPLTYSFSIITFIPLGMYAIAIVIHDGIREWQRAITLPLLALMGLCSGILLHPNPPYYLYNALYAHVLTLWNAVVEMYPEATELQESAISFSDTFWIILIGAIALFVGNAIVKKRLTSLPHVGIFLSGLSFVLMLAMLIIYRTVEYFIPVVTLTGIWLGLQIYEYHSQSLSHYLSVLSTLQRRILMIWMISLAFAAPALMTYVFYTDAAAYKGDDRLSAAANVLSTIPPGTKVFLPKFGDYPGLFFYAPHLNYSQGIEPFFSYLADSELFWIGYHAYYSPDRICPAPQCEASEISLYDALTGAFDAHYIAFTLVEPTDPEAATRPSSFLVALESDQRYEKLFDMTRANQRTVIYEIK